MVFSLLSYLQNNILHKEMLIIDDGYTFKQTRSQLVNDSEFTKKWEVFAKIYLELNLNKNDRKEVAYIESNPNPPCNYIVYCEPFSLFIEHVLSDFEIAPEFLEIREAYRSKIDAYARGNELAVFFVDEDEYEENPVFDMVVDYESDEVENIIKRDWHCFLQFSDGGDGHYNEWWIVNINPDCALFEHVIHCSHNLENNEMYHYSEFQNKQKSLKWIISSFLNEL